MATLPTSPFDPRQAVRLGVLCAAATLGVPAVGAAQLVSSAARVELRVRVVEAAPSMAATALEAWRAARETEVGVPVIVETADRARGETPVALEPVAARTRGGRLAGVRHSGPATVTTTELADGFQQHDVVQQSGEALVAIRIWIPLAAEPARAKASAPAGTAGFPDDAPRS